MEPRTTVSAAAPQKLQSSQNQQKEPHKGDAESKSCMNRFLLCIFCRAFHHPMTCVLPTVCGADCSYVTYRHEQILHQTDCPYFNNAYTTPILSNSTMQTRAQSVLHAEGVQATRDVFTVRVRSHGRSTHSQIQKTIQPRKVNQRDYSHFTPGRTHG